MDYRNTAQMANSRIGDYRDAVECENEPRSGFTTLRERLGAVLQHIHDIANRLESTGDGILGAVPHNGGLKPAQTVEPSGELPAIHATIDDIVDGMARISDATNRLERI